MESVLLGISAQPCIVHYLVENPGLDAMPPNQH
jgi:hypothetical protein